MLVLTRKHNEFIDIDGGRIQVCVVEIRGDKVRLGITAPIEVEVNRREIQEEKDRERESLRLQSEHDSSSTDFD
jgi:carbon storage regulator